VDKGILLAAGAIERVIETISRSIQPPKLVLGIANGCGYRSKNISPDQGTVYRLQPYRTNRI